MSGINRPIKELRYRYNPSKIMKSFDEVNLLKVGAPHVPEACLPVGTEGIVSETQVVKIPINNDILNHVFSIGGL